MAVSTNQDPVGGRPPRRRLANAIRALAMDAVQKANSGHPGMPMGMADIAEVLWNDHLRHNPANPHWPNRDRFVLSNGHGSMLLYALLHLTGYDLPMDELKTLPPAGSKTPGHPEHGIDAGRRDDHRPARPGPRERGRHGARGALLAAEFNRPGHDDRRSPHLRVPRRRLPDGRHLARSLLARRHAEARQADRVLRRQRHLDRRRKVDSGWFTDDTPKRFEAYGWHVMPHVDGHDADAVDAAIEAGASAATTDRR